MAGLSGSFMKILVKGTGYWFGNGSVKFLRWLPHEKRGQDKCPGHLVACLFDWQTDLKVVGLLSPFLAVRVNVQLLLALRTQAVDFNVITGYQVASLCAGLLIQFVFNLRKFGREDVRDFSTVFTDNVVMGPTVKVVANSAVVVGKFNHDAQVDEQVQGVVDRGHAQIGRLNG